MKVAKAPEGESRSDYDIFRGLAARLGVEGEFSEGRDEMQWLSHLYAQWQGKVQALGVMLPPFESFWNAPTTEIPQDGQGVVMFSQLDRKSTRLNSSH